MLKRVAVDKAIEPRDARIDASGPCNCSCTSGVTGDRRELPAEKLSATLSYNEYHPGNGDDDA